MNPVSFVRYTIDFAIVIPGLIFAVLPLSNGIKPKFFAWLGMIILLCLVGAYICERYYVPSKYMFAAVMIVFFAGYMLLMKSSVSKKLFCIFNSAMLCEVCALYANLLTAPYKLLNLTSFATTFTILLPELAVLGVAIPVSVIFWKTLSQKLPLLLNEERFAGAWKFMFLLPIVMMLLIWWMIPISPVVVITGRVRPIALALAGFIVAAIFMFYHITWHATVSLTESARLQQEKTFLQMEAKRYEELKEYMTQTRTMRHDFRQHILVISQLTESRRIPELKDYLSQLTKSTGTSYVNYCANKAIDAIASHYDYIARAQCTSINWKLELPYVLPMKESDYCAMLGNLLENALCAVKILAPEKRRVNVISSMLSEFMLGLSVDNAFSGNIFFSKEGLPVAKREGHGTGLISVKNTVNRYGGTMNINAEDEKFSVDIILYCNS